MLITSQEIEALANYQPPAKKPVPPKKPKSFVGNAGVGIKPRAERVLRLLAKARQPLTSREVEATLGDIGSTLSNLRAAGYVERVGADRPAVFQITKAGRGMVSPCP